jgi:hypothetical protein
MSEVQVKSAGALAIPDDMMAMLAAEAKAAAAVERPAISRISLKSGVMSYAGAPVPGNKLEAVILAASFRNVFYAGRYDANNIVSPNCFALDVSDAGMAPHGNVSHPEHPTCAGCKNNEWGSDPNGGRGKACKQTRRLVLLPGHAVETGVDAVKTAEMAILDLPVTSVRNYSQFVNALAASANVPTYAAIAQISVIPDAKTQFKVMFQPMRVLPSMDMLTAMKTRLEGAKLLSIEPYEETAAPVDENDQVTKEAAAKASDKKKKF